MPIYEYKCSHCGYREEIIQKINEIGPLHCAQCQTQGSVNKEVSFNSFQLKGSGWYKDLYASHKPNTSTVSDNKTNTCNSSCTKA